MSEIRNDNGIHVLVIMFYSSILFFYKESTTRAICSGWDAAGNQYFRASVQQIIYIFSFFFQEKSLHILHLSH